MLLFTKPPCFLILCLSSLLLPIPPTSALPTSSFPTRTNTTTINAYVENNCVFPIHALQSWCNGAGGTAHISPHTAIWFGHESGRDECGVSIALTRGEEGEGEGVGEGGGPARLERRMYEVRYQVDSVGGIVYGLGASEADGFGGVAGMLEVEGSGCAPIVFTAGDGRDGDGSGGSEGAQAKSCDQAGDVRFYLC
ncbi:uncharacterized protein CC84DRAFT_1173710 [Paraphaeosphaeria sporulosa]|uniref:Ecp2 effector protein domain-containing protein n=1 Tax=Paraphaeosphaeria sporulosa TaxID=1460663 RepID=A0A177CN54_9PLEO|nr:uncharacterized protein CC84DRAFT_1173710 [Paraphaeosphaeria sporulosa]OAG08177.1 hypothetical protein CC84DRAFT_1173710 [Paraphaeosphaeria sporulosa]